MPESVRGHVILCRYDGLAPGLIERMHLHDIPCYVLEPDPEEAARMDEQGISVVVGDRESQATYEALRVGDARLVVANDLNTVDTNIVLTVREISEDVPVAALAVDPDSVDILELSGASRVLPLKRWLGEQLASRLDVGPARAHVVGSLGKLTLAEIPVHDTRLAGRVLRELDLREAFGLNVVGVWNRARLRPAHADTRLSERSLAVVVGSAERSEKLEATLGEGDAGEVEPVLVLGAARSAARPPGCSAIWACPST